MSQRATCQPTTDLRTLQPPLQPLQPRPQIVMPALAANPPVAEAASAPGVATSPGVATASDATKEAAKTENNLPTISETNYVLKRTSDPEQRV